MRRKTRKTVEVKQIRSMINDKLGNKNYSQDEKKSLAMFLEDVLHATNNYQGFNWTAWVGGGCQRWVDAGRPEGPEKDLITFGGPEKDFYWDRVYY